MREKLLVNLRHTCAVIFNSIFALALFTVPSIAIADSAKPRAENNAVIDPSNLSGSWYNPDRDGEGFHIELLGNDAALVIWFTYPGPSDNEQTEQAWILGVGTYSDGVITIADANKAHGPEFGAGYDKDALVSDPWGDMTVTFLDENNVVVDYTGVDGDGVRKLIRLTTLAAQENAGGLPIGISGAWYDPETNGQGWFVEVISKTLALVYWFTYDENGNQAWNLGVGNIINNSIVLKESQTGKGTRFGPEFRVEDITREMFAALTLNFDDCNSGNVSYTTPAGEHSGSFPIVRLTSIEGLGCNGLPDIEDGRLTVMSNPTDSVLTRYQGPDGTIFDTYGVSDELGNEVSASGALVILPNDETVRMYFDAERQHYELVNSRTGLRFTFREDGNGDRYATVIDPVSEASITIPLSTAQEDKPEISKPDAATGAHGPSPATDLPGNATETSHLGQVAEVVVNYCGGPTNGAKVDFILGDRTVAATDPTNEQFLTRTALTIPASLLGTSPTDFRYEAIIPTDELELSPLALDARCSRFPDEAKGFCRVIEVGAGFCAEIVGGVNIPISFNSTDIFELCSLDMAVVNEYCAMHELKEVFQCGAGGILTIHTDFRKARADIWAKAELGGVTEMPQYSLPKSANLNQDVYSFEALDLPGEKAVLMDAYTEPGFVVSGSGYKGHVQVGCLAKDDQLTAIRLQTAESFTCNVNEFGLCTFDIPSTDPSWAADVFHITGPNEFSSTVIVGLFSMQGMLTGQWALVMIDTRNSCEGETTGKLSEARVFVTQTGSSLSVCDLSGSCLSGSIQGSSVNWNGSFIEDGGTTTVSVSMTLSEDRNTMVGESNWSWTNGGESCSGTTDVNAFRL